MKTSDLDLYFSALDKDLIGLSSQHADEFIKLNFPRYKHIGGYVDPLNKSSRAFFLSALQDDLNDYSFDPLLSFPIDQVKYSKQVLHPDCRCFRRSKIKLRPIKTCSHRDRILYSSWNHYLSSLHKKWLTQHHLNHAVSAYIPETGKFNAHYAKIAFDYIQGKEQYYAIALDVKSFFDKIPHPELKKNLITLLKGHGRLEDDLRLSRVDYRLLKSVTEYTFINLEDLQKVEQSLKSGNGMYFNRHRHNWDKLRQLSLIKSNKQEGIPQGLACSGVLSNIAMMEFDLSMNQACKKLDSMYIRYADDIFIVSEGSDSLNSLSTHCRSLLDDLNLPIADNKTEEFGYSPNSNRPPTISYLGLECTGNEITVRKNGVNKFYDRTRRFIFSYVLTCRRRDLEPSRKKIRAIFSHSGKNNYYAYLKRVHEVFESDNRYKLGGIKGVLKNHIKWLDKVFDEALKAPLNECKKKYKKYDKCTCPLQRDS